MANRESIFGGEWRRCLKEHYKYVIQSDDKATLDTLLPIMDRAGFREAELRQLYLEATMHSDDLPDDFVPDFDLVTEGNIEQGASPEPTFKTHPAECSCPSCMDLVLEDGHDEEGQPIDEEPEEEEQATGAVFGVAKPDEKEDVPRQKSLF